MTAGTGVPIKPYLYIEGKRLDNAFISGSCTSEIGKPATAVISLTPTNTIRHIMPRTHVVVACNDPWDPSNLEPYVIFEGEVLGIGFTKTDDGRAFIIHCADVSNYWHHVRQYWFNLSQSGGAFLDQFIRMTTGGAGKIATVAPYGVKGYLIQRLNLVSGEENLFLDSMIGLLDDIGNLSAFYQNARRRLRITDRVMRKNAGLVQNLFQLSFFGDYLQQLIQARSGESNLLTIVSLLLNIIYHEYVSILAPPYVLSEVIKRDKLGNPIRKKAGKSKIRQIETEKKKVVANFIFKPHIYTLPPPSCNVLFPNMYEGINYQRNFMAENTRMTLTPQVIERSSLSALKLKVFKRPQEVDSYFQLITERAGKDNRTKRRPEIAKYGDGEGQSSQLQEFEFMTNEERFKGISPAFQGLAPAPAMLSLSNQGKKGSDGKRTGGAPRYLHNVASYEYYMNKFVSRGLSVEGVFNFRPVVGYPMLILDDSEANMNMVAYLQGMTVSLNASSGVGTEYRLVLPREVDEVDLNRPIVDHKTGEFDMTVEHGYWMFNFQKMFTSEHAPPIPDWFDDDFKTVGSLTDLYASFFGENVSSSEDMRRLPAVLADAEGPINVDVETNTVFRAAVAALNKEYKLAVKADSEFLFVSEYTKRTFTRVLEMFAFLGALPKNLTENSPIPVADTDYESAEGFRLFTEAEVDTSGKSTSTAPSTHNIYDGRPIAHPFEIQLYNESKTKAKKANRKTSSGGKVVTATAKDNAPTGTNVENQPFVPISYPLSEKEIIKARRSVINMYRKELEEKRGFRG